MFWVLIETVLLATHSMFWLGNKNIIFLYALLTKCLNIFTIKSSPHHCIIHFMFFEIDAVCLFFVFFVQTFIFYKSMEEGMTKNPYSQVPHLS